MMNLRDRLPGTSGNRSFSKKMILISVTVLVGLGILFWYANQLVVSINPEDCQNNVLLQKEEKNGILNLPIRSS